MQTAFAQEVAPDGGVFVCELASVGEAPLENFFIGAALKYPPDEGVVDTLLARLAEEKTPSVVAALIEAAECSANSRVSASLIGLIPMVDAALRESVGKLQGRLLAEAGLPDGVFNVVHGDKAAVDAILNHPLVNAISFVGSTPIAKYIYETCARNGKRVQALGGAKNHAVVLPDADLAFTSDALIGAAYGSAGERCMAISVVVAVGQSADPLVAALADKARHLKIGAGDAEGVDMGPLVTRAHRDKVNARVMREMEGTCVPEKMPFDMKRMVYGGFKTLVEI